MLAGFGIADLTPPLGTALAGHFRARAARGIHDPLLAVAVAWESGGEQVAVCSCDLLCLTAEVTNRARELVYQQVGLPAERVMFAATHTHSGPELRSERGEVDQGYVELVGEKLATAVVLAVRDLRPATLLLTRGREERLSFNRRYHMRDGTVRTNPGVGNPDIVRPAGPIDPEVLGLWVWREGEPAGVVINFACHLDLLGAGNELVSAEVPGYLRQTLAGALARPCPVVYLNGTCGDINHIDVRGPARGGFAHAELMGRVLAGELLRSLTDGTEMEEAPLAVQIAQVAVQGRVWPPETVAWARQTAENAALPADSWDRIRARRILSALAAGQASRRAEVQALRIGALGLVGLPGEIFCALGLEVKAGAPCPATMVAELANDNLGYVPTPQAFEEGGYEVEAALWEPGLGPQLVATSLALLRELFPEACSERAG
jgi:neutral ceramidase